MVVSKGVINHNKVIKVHTHSFSSIYLSKTLADITRLGFYYVKI